MVVKLSSTCVWVCVFRFLFTDYNRLSSVGGETSMAEMIATLSDACEREFGFLATRLFRVFKNDETQGSKALAYIFTSLIYLCYKVPEVYLTSTVNIDANLIF